MENTSLDSLAEDQAGPLQELLRLAADEARRLGHHFVGTGHAAVAAVQLSGEQGSSVVEARSRLEELVGRGTAEECDRLQATPRLVQLVRECGAASGTDGLLATIHRLDAPVARTVLGVT